MSKKHHHNQAQAAQETAQQEPQEQPVAQEEQTAAPAKPDYYDQFVRLSAEFENFRKRTEREKAAFLAFGKKELAEKLLPSYEILLRQQEKWRKEAQQADGTLKSVLDGVNMIVGEMEKAFCAEGITRIDAIGKPYDPATQEVVAMVPAEKEQDGIVLQEVQMGFMMDGKVLRLARVIVGQKQEN